MLVLLMVENHWISRVRASFVNSLSFFSVLVRDPGRISVTFRCGCSTMRKDFHHCHNHKSQVPKCTYEELFSGICLKLIYRRIRPWPFWCSNIDIIQNELFISTAVTILAGRQSPPLMFFTHGDLNLNFEPPDSLIRALWGPDDSYNK